METNHILKSALTGESRQEKGDSKTCLFCGFRYFFRPIHVRDDLVLGSVSDSESESEFDRVSDSESESESTESLTPSPSLNPSKTLTNFLCYLV
jgi:hypothetical protein